MTVAKVWDGAQWITVNDLVGPRGPQGPQGIGAPPSGAAGGVLAGNYPDPTINRAATGGLLAAQRSLGQGTGYRAITNGQDFTVDNAGVVPLRVSYTPTVNCWWDVTATIGIFQKTDAAYQSAYLGLNLAPADQDGQVQQWAIEQQHSQVQTYQYRLAAKWFRLAAGVAYTCTARVSINGGTWQFNQHPSYIWMDGKVFAQ